jgi:hypothetical protein
MNILGMFGDQFIYVVLYVDNTFLIKKNKDIINEVKSHLSSKFDMKDLSVSNFILGMEIKIDHDDRKL